MKFRFKTQKFQVDAVNAIVDVFKGQPFIHAEEYTRDLGVVATSQLRQQMSLFEDSESGKSLLDDGDDIGFSNASIKISEDKILENIREIQSKSNLKESRELSKNLGLVSLDIEMETGTGKTYVYTRTIFELNKRYGWSKYIVVVPSIAIREGVKKSFEQTQEHFMDLYGKKIRFFIYNSSNLGQIDQFSKDSSINVMIINIQAFNTRNKESRRIYEKIDDFQSRRPIDVIMKNRPIVIRDEPQKMGGDATQETLKLFNPLFSINYSATHRDQHNLVYVLDALDAYNQKLVKKIEVKGFQVKNLRGTNGYLYLQKIAISANRPPRALIELEIDYNKSINRETRWFDVGDNLYNTSRQMNQYENGFTISEISPITNTVTFLSGDVLAVGNSTGDIAVNDVRRIQIRETILSHFDKEEELFDKGIKVLSLFFIDEVAKYREYDEDGNQLLGLYGKIFEEEYLKAINARGLLLDTPYYKYLKSIETNKTHNGYFSIDKKGRSIDSPVKRNSDESDDITAYDLILKDKERLLSFDEPTRFIFSHSALREGWDNPNVFQICTLKYSANDVQRHQEVGRGLRICVNVDGERIDATTPNINFHQINKLTVIANESYDDFVRGLQSQIQENLFDRPTKISENYFTNKTVRINGGDNTHNITSTEARQMYFYLVANQYIDVNGNVTNNYKNDKENNTLKPLPETLQTISDSIHTLVQRVYDNSVGIEIENANATKIEVNKLNDNFYKKEFTELWNLINNRYAYTVEFDSKELIEHAINAIDNELKVTRLIYTVETGEQKTEMIKEEIERGESFKNARTRSDTIKSFASEDIKYDLIGKIREKTQLTRKTVAAILKGINLLKFELFKINPEEFIKKSSNIINEQKSTMIVQHVSYNKTKEAPFDSDIFTQEKSKADYLKAFKAKKNVQDYVFEDSKGERKFAEDLDNADEVVVYAKLPKGFYIPTPVGNYSPDWAISFKKDSVRHVYFIAETKGSLDNLQLRKIEEAKIECATRLFKTMSDKNVIYGKVTKYEDLLSMLRQ
jgi:type III restriction enzyme